jgi:regulator of protease activity HflC (stomatin/prohibitin superfamily)
MRKPEEYAHRVPAGAVIVDNILLRNIALPQSLSESIANVQRQRQMTAAAEQETATARQRAARDLAIAQGDAAQLTARTRADAEMLSIRTTAQANANGYISINFERETDPKRIIGQEDMNSDGSVLLSRGKRDTTTIFFDKDE